MNRPLLCALIAALTAGCNPARNAAVGACESFITERLRSPSTYQQIKVDDSAVTFKSEGRDVQMVTIEYDAANAFGTPIRDSQQCIFEVDKAGNFTDDPDHAARMSAIGADEYARCCLLDEDDKLSNASDEDILKQADAVANAADEAIVEADRAIAEGTE